MCVCACWNLDEILLIDVGDSAIAAADHKQRRQRLPIALIVDVEHRQNLPEVKFE